MAGQLLEHCRQIRNKKSSTKMKNTMRQLLQTILSMHSLECEAGRVLSVAGAKPGSITNITTPVWFSNYDSGKRGKRYGG